MVGIESIHLTAFVCQAIDGHIEWHRSSATGRPHALMRGPSSLPVDAANLFLFDRAQAGVRPATVFSLADSLLPYLRWLESNSVDWRDFPVRRRDRCVFRYKANLIDQRDSGVIASSTASARMRVVIAFYRWLISEKLLRLNNGPWEERRVSIGVPDLAGLTRTFTVATTDLVIPNRQRGRSELEDGLTPLNADHLATLLDLAARYAPPELQLMLSFGCMTGMRLGSICDLKVESLRNAIPDPMVPDMYWLTIGPSAKPPVATKFDVSGRVLLPGPLFRQALAYAGSRRRTGRRPGPGSDLLFLTRSGAHYRSPGDAGRSRAVNVAMTRLRSAAASEAPWITELKFHQTRATFATMVAAHALRVMDVPAAVGLVRNLLLHRDEATSLRYIKFVQGTEATASLSNEFTRLFFELSTPKESASLMSMSKI